jgi:hypothetical protein
MSGEMFSAKYLRRAKMRSVFIAGFTAVPYAADRNGNSPVTIPKKDFVESLSHNNRRGFWATHGRAYLADRRGTGPREGPVVHCPHAHCFWPLSLGGVCTQELVALMKLSKRQRPPCNSLAASVSTFSRSGAVIPVSSSINNDPDTDVAACSRPRRLVAVPTSN